MAKYNTKKYGVALYGATASTKTDLRLIGGNSDFSHSVVWEKFQLTVRKGLGAVASVMIDATDNPEAAPGVQSAFSIVVPTGEVFQMIPVTTQTTFYAGAASAPIVVYTYDLIDRLTACDRIPLPKMEFIESTSGEILRTLIPLLDSTLVVTNIVDGNSVPYLNTEDFGKLSDILRQQNVAAGNYIAILDPSSPGGLGITANYESSFGISGLSVDKDDHDFSPFKEPIVPSEQIINYQRIKGNVAGGPNSTVMEFREIDALDSSFKLGATPYGLDAAELLNVSMDGGDIGATDETTLPKITPIHYPTTVEVSDIHNTGSGVVCGFIGRNNITVLGVSVNPGSMGAVVGGATFSQATPFMQGGPAPSGTIQYSYNWLAQFTPGGLQVTIAESLLNADAGSTVLATITGISSNILTLSFPSGHTVNDLPDSIRIFSNGDPEDIRGFVTIKSRSGNTIEIDPIPDGLLVTDQIASGDGTTVIVTEKIVYSGAAPSNRFGKPKLIISGGSGISARGWSASYGPAIDVVLLANPYTGEPGRRLRVDTGQGTTADISISKSGNGAIATFVGDRLPLRGVIRLLLNYDEAKQADVVVEDAASQAVFGVRQGDLIQSETAITEAECTSIGQAIINDFAFPLPKGTILRESIFTSHFPIPPKTFAVDVPSEYLIEPATVPISEVSVEFLGGDYDPSTNSIVCVLNYHITLGEPDSVELINRELLAKQEDFGPGFRPLMATGPRISSGTWNDIDNVTLGISGGSITLAGKPASSSFDPADYATGDLHEAPVFIGGTVSDGSKVHKLFVEVIYPPLSIDTSTVHCHYSAKTNLITYTWGRPSGAQIYQIQRLLDEDNDPITPPIWRQVDEIFNESYPLPYEPLSKSIKVRVQGMGDKYSGDFLELACTLPTLPAPTPFEVVKIKPGGRLVVRVGPPPTGKEITGRAEFIRFFVLRKDVGTSDVTLRSEFNQDSDDGVIVTHKIVSDTGISRYHLDFKDTDKDDIIWASAAWVDRFGDEGTIVTPFDATNPTVTVGSISLVDFFQSAPQVLGGAIEDDDDQTAGVEFSGKYRIHLGQSNSAIKMRMKESDPVEDYSIGNYDDNRIVHSHLQDVSDEDLANGYVDIIMNRDFRWAKKKHRTYFPSDIVFYGPKIREVGQQQTVEKVYLIGYIGTPPPIESFKTDAIFDAAPFQFHPGIAGLTNTLQTVIGGSIRQKNDGYLFDWDAIEEVSVRRYLVLISTVPFGTKGPGQDITIATDGTDTPGVSKTLNAIRGNGIVTVYNVGNTAKNVDVQAIDVQSVSHRRFYNDEVFGGITITSGQTYFVSVLAQKKNGRWSTNFSTVLNTTSGLPVTTGDLAMESAPQNILLRWKDGFGFKGTWDRPATNATSHQFYYASIFNDSVPARFMDPDTGVAFASGTTENQAKFKVEGSHLHLKLKRSQVDPIFLASGVRLRIWGTNIVGGVLTESTNTSTSSLITPGSDSSGGAVDVGAPDVATGTATWKNSKGIIVKLNQSANNNNTVHDHEFGFFYPATANGTTVARNLFNPDTGADIGIVSTASTTATFGRGGNSGFFGPSRFHGHVTKATLPAGAITGGIGIIARIYNFTNGSTGPIETTNPSSNIGFGSSGTTTSIAALTGNSDFVFDRDAANWVNSTSQATAVQAGLTFKVNKKLTKARWDTPTHIQSSPDESPKAIAKYGFKIRAGNDSNNWVDINNPGTPITTDANSEFFTEPNEINLNILRLELASIFQINGLKIAVRSYNFNQTTGTLSAGPFTEYSTTQTLPGDAISEDTAAASVVGNIALTWTNRKGWKGTWIRPASNISSIKGYKISYVDILGTNFMNANTGQLASPNTEIGATILVTDTHHTTHLKFSEIALQFQAGVRIKVIPVNVVNGVETDGTSTTSPLVIPIRDDAQTEDTAAANAVTNLNLTFTNKRGWKTTWIRSSSNVKSLIGYKIFYTSGLGGTFMDPHTGQIAASQAAATILVTDTHHTTHLKRSEIASTFITNGVFATVLAVNIVSGVETNGTAAVTSTILPNEADNIPGDIAAPSAPQSIDVQEYFGVFIVTPVIPLSNVNSQLEWQVQMANSATPGVNVRKEKTGSGPITFKRKTDVLENLWFHARVQNMQNRGTFSVWTTVGPLSTYSRPLEDVIGNSVIDITILNGFDNVFSDTALTVPAGTGPMRVTRGVDESGSPVNVIEVQVPSGVNAFSVTDIQFQKFTSPGSLQTSEIIPFRPGVLYKISPAGTLTRSLRIRYRNMYRGAGSDGWSSFSNYVPLPPSSQFPPPYNPGNPINGDLEATNNYPNNYPVY
jgi:hypothetical protein